MRRWSDEAKKYLSFVEIRWNFYNLRLIWLNGCVTKSSKTFFVATARHPSLSSEAEAYNFKQHTNRTYNLVVFNFHINGAAYTYRRPHWTKPNRSDLYWTVPQRTEKNHQALCFWHILLPCAGFKNCVKSNIKRYRSFSTITWLFNGFHKAGWIFHLKKVNSLILSSHWGKLSVGRAFSEHVQ